MSSYGLLTVGDLVVSDLRDGIPNELLAVFRDEWLVRRHTTVGEWDPDCRWTHDYQRGEPVMVYEYRAPADAVAQRLDALGNTLEVVLAELEYNLHGEGRVRRVFADDPATPPELAERLQAEEAALDALTPDDVLRRLQAGGELPTLRRFDAPIESTDWLYQQVADMWPLYALRAALVACPDRQVQLDITQMVEDGLLDDETPETVASHALATLRLQTSAHTPIVILTEGKTDAEFLQAAVDILYPHLDDVLRFLDYNERPDGGAGALVRLVRAFAAAGIANQVVAVFDNDTAAADALRPLARASLPLNITVLQYPPLRALESYPTLGPPTTDNPAGATVLANVNGLAASIEMYLGEDILTRPDGALRPVQWRSYIETVGAYQGEVTDKAAIQAAFRAKVQACRTESTQLESTDWSGLRAILDAAIAAAALRAGSPT
jgi:HEPN/Toprim N-terminal domain 1